MNKELILVLPADGASVFGIQDSENSFTFRGKTYVRAQEDNAQQLLATGMVLTVSNNQIIQLAPQEPTGVRNFAEHVSDWPRGGIHPECWGLKKIGAEAVRKEIDDSLEKPVIAVIDTGVDYTHSELKDNLWTNPSDKKTHGYNALNDKLDPMDDHGHGTHCSGTIAGETVGVFPYAQLMGCKFLDARGGGTMHGAMKAIAWAVDHGATVTSNSWGGGGFEKALYQIFADSPEVIHICAAGNSADNNDYDPHYPSSYDLPNIIGVAASQPDDDLASFSCYGRIVHLAAPGRDVYSSIPGNRYAKFSGTSMATPHVAGVAASLAYLELTGTELARVITSSVDRVAKLQGRVMSGGRLNAREAFFSVF